MGGSKISLQIEEAKMLLPVPVAPVINNIPKVGRDCDMDVEPMVLRIIRKYCIAFVDCSCKPLQ